MAKTRAWKQIRATAARRRKALKDARKSNKERARKAVKRAAIDTARHLSRMQRLARLSAQTRVKWANKQKQGKSAPIVLLPPPQRWLPEWKPNLWKDEPMEATKAA